MLGYTKVTCGFDLQTILAISCLGELLITVPKLSLPRPLLPFIILIEERLVWLQVSGEGAVEVEGIEEVENQQEVEE